MKYKPDSKTTISESAGYNISGLRNDRTVLYIAAAIIVCVTFALYLPSLQHGFLANWDDDRYVVDNVHIRSLNFDFFRWAFLDYKTNLWHPIAWISHAVDYAIWGMNPFGHHLTSIVLHAVNTGVVVFLAAKLMNTAGMSKDATGWETATGRRNVLLASVVTGLLFGIHPLHVESVAWVTERKDLLYSLFYMLSIMYYIRSEEELPSEDSQHNFLLNRNYLFSLLLFFLSLCSKPMAVTLPALLLLLDWYPLQRMDDKKNIVPLLLEKLPFLLLTAMVSVITVVSQKDIGGLKSLSEAPPLLRLLLGVKSLMLYIFNTIAPVNLLPLYPYPKDLSLFKLEYAAAVLFVVAVSAACLLFKKKRYLLAIWLFFVLCLLPVLGLLQTGVQAMADRFVYLPVMGPFLLVGLGISHIWSKTDDLKVFRRSIQATVIALVIASAISLSLITNRQIGVWKNAIVMWSFLIDKDSGRDPSLYIYRATALEKSGQQEKALDDYSRVLIIDPKSDRAYFNRGTNYLQQGKFDLAIEDYTTVIKLVPQEADAYNNRGNAYLRKGNVEQAIKDISVAIEKKPSFYPSYVNRSNAFAHKGELDKAIQDVSKAISLNPELLDMYVVRGNLNMKTGNFEQGMQDYKTACEKGSQEGCRKAIFPF